MSINEFRTLEIKKIESLEEKDIIKSNTSHCYYHPKAVFISFATKMGCKAKLDNYKKEAIKSINKGALDWMLNSEPII